MSRITRASSSAISRPSLQGGAPGGTVGRFVRQEGSGWIDASPTDTPAQLARVGFRVSATEVRTTGSVTLSGLTPGRYFLAAAGGYATTPPTTGVIRLVGTAFGTTELDLMPDALVIGGEG